MEKWLRILAGSGLLLLLLAALFLTWAAPRDGARAAALDLPGVFPQDAAPGAGAPAADYQLLVNPGLEVYDATYGQFEGVDCQVASGWSRFWYGGPAPCWMDTRVFAASHLGADWVDRIEGDTSQLLVATEPYTAGLWQQVGGLTPGVGYGFHAALLSIFQTSFPPAVDGTMIKEVGLDPSGGTDPLAATVVWSIADDHDEGPWALDLRASAFAQAPTMTVFMRVTSPYPAGPAPYLNLGFLDSAILAQTPVVTATSPAFSLDPTFVVRWDNAVAAPGLKRLRWYDVQWLDEAEGVWHDWITETRDLLLAPFAGEAGHAYRFRARAYQRYLNDAHLYSPYRAEGDTRTLVQGARLAGWVLGPQGSRVPGATVSISGTAYAASSSLDGSYRLDLPFLTGPQTITIDHPWYLAPEPVYGLNLDSAEGISLTWALRPPDDGVDDGGFESGLVAWSASAGPGGLVAVVAEPVHTGRGALALGSTAPSSLSVAVSQTLVVTNAWQPTLSFWYLPPASAGVDALNVDLVVVTRTTTATLPVTATYLFTPVLAGGGWQHLWYGIEPAGGALSGTVTVRFRLWNDGQGETTTVYLDEVSLGASPGGPYRLHLPLIVR